MKSNEPINLMSFRSEAYRQHNRVVERQYRTALGLVAVLCLATAMAFVTLRPAQKGLPAQEMTARGASISIDRG
jgi:hypothetical protein